MTVCVDINGMGRIGRDAVTAEQVDAAFQLAVGLLAGHGPIHLLMLSVGEARRHAPEPEGTSTYLDFVVDDVSVNPP